MEVLLAGLGIALGAAALIYLVIKAAEEIRNRGRRMK